MDIEEIRNKYKSILQEDTPHNYQKGTSTIIEQNQEELSQREWINIVKREKQKRVLTQASTNKQNCVREQKQPKKTIVTGKRPNHKLSTEQIIIDLKQKLAQSLLNCTRKDAQLSEFQNLILRKNQEIKLQQKSIIQLKRVIEDKDSLIFEEKFRQDKLQNQIKLRDNSIDQIKLQNELLKKHIENYAKEIANMNQKWKQQQKYLEKADKQKQKVQSLKSKIQKLKDDIKRLQFLLSDNETYAPLLVSLQGKHFLGRPNKESKQLQYWYPESLIAGVQQFLKREQIGFGNKAFSESLTKFIYGLLQRSQKTGEKKCQSKYTSRIKQMERKKNQIFNVFDVGFEQQSKKRTSRNSRMNASSLRKTTPLSGNSRLKSRDFSICLQKSLCFDRQTLSSMHNLTNTNGDSKVSGKKSFIIQGLEKSVRGKDNCKSHVILELIESFCKGIEKLFKLDNKTLAQEKIVQLCDWLKESVEEIYHLSGCNSQENNFKQTGKWKTVADC